MPVRIAEGPKPLALSKNAGFAQKSRNKAFPERQKNLPADRFGRRLLQKRLCRKGGRAIRTADGTLPSIELFHVSVGLRRRIFAKNGPCQMDERAIRTADRTPAHQPLDRLRPSDG
jgi:hypothetical protein